MSSAKCRTAVSVVYIESGTGVTVSVGFSRKAIFRSSTEVCRFMWMRVMEFFCFLWVGVEFFVVWGYFLGSVNFWVYRYVMMGIRVEMG